MTTGRRPNGLCGAAILISAKIHGFRRTPAQIVKAVHVCEETIRKRLGEFKSTNTAQLTRAELKEIENTESDPLMFKIEETCFEPPAITKRQIIKSLKMEAENADEGEQEQLFEELHDMMTLQTSKIEKKL